MRSGHKDCKYQLRTARGSREIEEVFRFRYEHFFHCFAAAYPGIDHSARRLFEPHDATSIHYCAFDAGGDLCAVSTATPARSPDAPSSWRNCFKLGAIPHEELNGVVVSTRMVIRPEHRGRELFNLFYRYIMTEYLAAGIDHAVHCCSPGLICRYESLGHRLYGDPHVISSGLLRVSMFIALDDPDHLRRVGSPIAGLCASGAPRRGAFDDLECRCNFRLLSGEERLEYVRSRLGAEKFREIGEKSEFPDILQAIAHASPLRLAAGMSHSPPPGGGFLCLVLSGAVRERGKDKIAGPGLLAGAEMLRDPLSSASAFTVVEDSEVLVFDRATVRHLAARGGGRIIQRKRGQPCGMQ